MDISKKTITAVKKSLADAVEHLTHRSTSSSVPSRFTDTDVALLLSDAKTRLEVEAEHDTPIIVEDILDDGIEVTVGSKTFSWSRYDYYPSSIVLDLLKELGYKTKYIEIE